MALGECGDDLLFSGIDKADRTVFLGISEGGGELGREAGDSLGSLP